MDTLNHDWLIFYCNKTENCHIYLNGNNKYAPRANQVFFLILKIHDNFSGNSSASLRLERNLENKHRLSIVQCQVMNYNLHHERGNTIFCCIFTTFNFKRKMQVIGIVPSKSTRDCSSFGSKEAEGYSSFRFLRQSFPNFLRFRFLWWNVVDLSTFHLSISSLILIIDNIITREHNMQYEKYTT